MTDLIYFLPILFGLSMAGLGMRFENYPLGLLGGVVLMSFAVAILVDPINSLTGLANTVTGVTILGSGAYLFIVGSVEEIQRTMR